LAIFGKSFLHYYNADIWNWIYIETDEWEIGYIFETDEWEIGYIFETDMWIWIYWSVYM
jgi:hypothetical protein